MATIDGYDAALHLLDRQVVDVEDRLVAKVDDVELTPDADGALVVTGLLAGLPALLPRFGGRVGDWLLERYVQVGEPHADRAKPSVIELDHIEAIGSGVELGVPRARLLRPRDDEEDGGIERWRLGYLTGMPVRCPRLPRRSRVLDVRLSGVPGVPDVLGARSRVTVVGLIVGPGRPGALLGYERKSQLGPSPVAHVVRRLHRHARIVALGDGVEIDRDAGEVRIGDDVELERLG